MPTPGKTTSLTRIAPTGVSVALSIPEEFGTHRWFASTKLASQQGVRQFTIAPVGQYRMIPKRILPNAKSTSWQRRGHDIVLFEAVDRSNSCLVFLGPYHEATTWFGGPAPDQRGLNTVVGMVDFVDSAQGAVLKPRLSHYVRTFGTIVVGSGTSSLLMIRSATEGLSSLQEWSGRRVTGGELWRTNRALPQDQAARVGGTIQEWRYIWANPSCVVDVLMHPQETAPVSGSVIPDLVAAFDRFTAHWLVGKGEKA